MPYIGTSPSNGVRRKHTYTATASQTSFSGAGAEGATLSYNDSNFVDVYQNGVKLSEADYTSTSGTAIVLATGATVSDMIEIVVYDVFSVADTVSKADGGTFDGNVTMAGTLGVTGIGTFTDDIIIGDGKTIGSASDVDAMTIASNGQVTFSQTLIGTALDISGNIDIDGTTETDVLTINGSQLKYKTFGTSSLLFGDDSTGTIDGANYNTGIGDNVFGALTTGDHNTLTGYNSGASITTAINNTLFGSTSGDALVGGSTNTVVGSNALSADTQGSRATAMGYQALASQNFSSATDSYNTAVGYLAGSSVSTGIKNTIIGGLAGDVLTDADFNVAVGYGALSEDHKGDKSVAIGAFALEAQEFTTAQSTFNVAVGYQCLASSTTAQYNTAVGFQAGLTVSTGSNNTLIGQGAGQDITDGAYNTCLGFQTMTHDRNTNGNRNTVIGSFADTSSTNSDDQIILGYNVIGTGNNAFTFGKDGTDSNIDFGATSITAPSDERYKEEITSSTAGLSFINDLRPVTFKWKKEKDVPSDHKSYVADSDTRVMGRGEKIQHGFVAQEVKAVIDNHSEVKDGFGMWKVDDSDGRQRLAPSELIPMLVKAIQELSAEVTALKG